MPERKFRPMQENVTSTVRYLLTCVCFLAMPPLAQAQTPERPPSSHSEVSPRLEVTAEFALMGGLIDVSDLHAGPQLGLSGVGADVRVHLTPRVGVGIRGLVATGAQFYDLATIFHLTSSGRSHTFLRFGAGGHHEFRDVQESRRTNQDHSTTVFPPTVATGLPLRTSSSPALGSPAWCREGSGSRWKWTPLRGQELARAWGCEPQPA